MTKRQCIANQIDAASVFARADFVMCMESDRSVNRQERMLSDALTDFPQYPRWNRIREPVGVDFSVIGQNSSMILLAMPKADTQTSYYKLVILDKLVQLLWCSFLRSGMSRSCLSRKLPLLLLSFLPLALQLS
jgi:hypothetical protein